MTRLKSHQIGIGNREPLSKGSDDIEEAENDCALNNNNIIAEPPPHHAGPSSQNYKSLFMYCSLFII